MIRKLKTIGLIAFSLIALNLFAQEKCASASILNKQILKDPTLLNKIKKSELKTQDWINKKNKNKNSNIILTIPVVFHVVYNTAVQNISDAQIMSQLDIINADFSRTNLDALPPLHPFFVLSANTNIQFCLATRDPNGNATNGITRTFTNNINFVAESPGADVRDPADGGKANWDPTSYLNIWICNLPPLPTSGILGFAQFPDMLASLPQADGVVVRHEATGNNGTAGTNGFQSHNQGRTLTHEIGHWLNLRHIWGDNKPNCGDDFVNDTPPTNIDNGGCPTFPHQPNNICGSDINGVMYMNYMDYVDDTCMNMFTFGQASRMSATLFNTRASLLNSLGCTAPLTTNNFDLENTISIYPNPTAGILNIKLNNFSNENINVLVTDISGKKLQHFENISIENITMDLSMLSSGTYFLQFSNNVSTTTKKVIVKK